MIKEIKKLKNIFKKGPAPYGTEGSRSGFVLLFTVTLTSIILAITLGVANVALKEVKFGTEARATNDAFFAADTGIEYVLYHDKLDEYTYTLAEGDKQIFPPIIISGLGGTGTACVKVIIEKDNTSPPFIKTNIVSTGYNVGNVACLSSSPSRIERQIKVSY